MWSGKCPFGEMSIGEVSLGELSSGKCQSGDCPVGELSAYPKLVWIELYVAPIFIELIKRVINQSLS